MGLEMAKHGDLVVFIDAENASPKWGVPLYVWLCQNYAVRECYCVGNRNTIPQDYLLLEGREFHVVNSMLGKDSADTWLVMLGTRELCLRRSVKKIAIFSNDRDFAPLAFMAAERGKEVVIYAANLPGTQGLVQTIKRTEAGDAASVQLIELDKLVGRQLDKPKLEFKERLWQGARNLVQAPLKLWRSRGEQETTEGGTGVMEHHELVPASKPRRPRRVKTAEGKEAQKCSVTKPKAEPQRRGRPAKISFSQVGGTSEKLFEALPKEIRNYFARRRSQQKLILAPGPQGEILEVPFVDGMKMEVLYQMMLKMEIIKNGHEIEGMLKTLGLVRKDGCVFYDTKGLSEAADRAGKKK